MQTRTHCWGRECGFTLVELLVVVAIIAVLIAILLPAMKKAKESAIQLRCLTQLRQLTTLAAMYSGDNSGAWPNTGKWNYVHTYAFRPTWPFGDIGRQAFALGQLYAAGYYKDLSLPCCPAGPMKVATTHRDLGTCTYGYRWGPHWDNLKTLYASGAGHCLIVDNFYYFADGIPNHPDGVNAVFMDGSGKWLNDSPVGTWRNFIGKPSDTGGPLFEQVTGFAATHYFDDAY